MQARTYLTRSLSVCAVILGVVALLVSDPGRAAETTVASDGFSRSVTGGWGTSDSGTPWVSNRSTTSVNGSAGLLPVTPGADTTVHLAGISASDQTLSASYTFGAPPAAGGGTYVSALMRYAPGASGVSARIVVDSAGEAVLSLRHLTSTGGNVQLGNALTLPFAISKGTAVNVKTQVMGASTATVAAKVWKVGAGEPSAWQVSAAAAGLPSSGTAAVKSYGSTGGTANSVAVDNLSLSATANTAPVPGFTTTTNGLSVSVNAAASSDPDGTIASYEWDFGDGRSGSGRTASHTYASGGSFTVTLTVADDKGAVARAVRSVTVTATGSAPSFKLFWSDDFSSSTLDASRWRALDSSFGSNMGQIQCHKPANATLAGGSLMLTAKKQSATCGTGGSLNRSYSSAFVTSSDAKQFYPLYGRYEIRARIPQGQGIGAAFWLRHRISSSAAEIDIMETFHSQAPGTVTQTLHFPRTLGTNVTKVTTQVESAKADLSGWHTYAVEITPAAADNSQVRFRYYVDDKMTKEWVNTKASTWTNGYLNDAWDITISLPVGGSWWGSPQSNLGFLSSDMIGGTSPNKCALTYAAPPNGPASCPTDKNKDGVADIWFAKFPATYQVDYVRVLTPQ